MKITMCDRCGNKVVNNSFPIQQEILPRYHVTAIYKVGINQAEEENLDLCSKCQSELRDWFNLEVSNDQT